MDHRGGAAPKHGELRPSDLGRWWEGGAPPRWNWRARARVVSATPFGVAWVLSFHSERVAWGPEDQPETWARETVSYHGELWGQALIKPGVEERVELRDPDDPREILYVWTPSAGWTSLRRGLVDLDFLGPEPGEWICAMTAIARAAGLEWEEGVDEA